MRGRTVKKDAFIAHSGEYQVAGHRRGCQVKKIQNIERSQLFATLLEEASSWANQPSHRETSIRLAGLREAATQTGSCSTQMGAGRRTLARFARQPQAYPGA